MQMLCFFVLLKLIFIFIAMHISGFEGLEEISQTQYDDFFKMVKGRLGTMMDTAKTTKVC